MPNTNHRARPTTVLSIGFAASLALACSSDGPPTLDTGLPADTVATDVTPAEAMAACEAYEDVANGTLGPSAQLDISCTLAGIASHFITPGTCGSVANQCRQEAPEPARLDFDCENAISFAPSGCTATIGELERCVNAVSAGIDSLTSQVNCGLVNDLERLGRLTATAEGAVNPQSYDACAGLSTNCLELLGWAAAALPDTSMP